MAAFSVIAGVVAAAAAATTTAVSIDSSQKQSDAADKQKKLLGEKQAHDARAAKEQKEKEERLALGALANMEAKRKNPLTGATLPGATPQQSIGTVTSPATKTAIGA